VKGGRGGEWWGGGKQVMTQNVHTGPYVECTVFIQIITVLNPIITELTEFIGNYAIIEK
jgi:hypothetical protein